MDSSAASFVLRKEVIRDDRSCQVFFVVVAYAERNTTGDKNSMVSHYGA